MFTEGLNNSKLLNELKNIGDRFFCGLAICRTSPKNPKKSYEICYLSAGLAEIYETDVEHLRRGLSENILFSVHSADCERVRSDIFRVLEGKEAEQSVSYRIVTPTGHLKWLTVRAEAVEAPELSGFSEPSEGSDSFEAFEASEGSDAFEPSEPSGFSEPNSGNMLIYATYTDITDLKKVEHMVDVALFNTGVSIWEYDFKRRCIIQYQNSTEMHGFEQIVADVPESLVECGFVHTDSAPAFLAMYDKLFNGEPFAEGVFKVQTSDRTGYWYEHIRYTSEFDENGKPFMAVGMSTDETQRQLAIEKYARELEKGRVLMKEDNLLVHATFDLTTGETLDYRFADGTPVPKEAKTMFSFGRENASLLIDSDERAQFLAVNDENELKKRFDNGETEFSLEHRRMLPDGSVKWIRNLFRLLRDPHSEHILLYEYWFDIEDEKMMELMYRSVTTDNYDFVALINGKTRAFHTIHKEGLSFHMPPAEGNDADEVTRLLFDDCVLPEDRETAFSNALVGNIKTHLLENNKFVFTYRMQRPDGTLRYKKVTQYYIDSLRELIAVMREDVTEIIQEEAEKSKLLSDALDAATCAGEAKSTFLSRVSHELRTPLNAIIGFMDLAKNATHEQMTEYLRHTDVAAKQLLSIINDVLDVSSIESGKLKIVNAPFNLKTIIQKISDLYLPQCLKKRLIFDTVYTTPIDEWLMGDAARVNQILQNLMNNAVKFTEHGRIALRISQRLIDNSTAMIVFEISDTGCGMGKDIQERLFKPFEQESAQIGQKFGGSGLGLSIAGSLISLMNGTVSVESRVGEGSTFTVSIPFVRSDYQQTSSVIDGVDDIHVLVVDDSAEEGEYMSAVLGRIGIRYLYVDSGAAALTAIEKAQAENDSFNVCLVDWKMPNMNGLETTRFIRERFGQEMIVIVVSALDHYQANESVRAAGANMYISKPLLQSSLFDLFMTLTGGQIVKKSIKATDIDLRDMRILLAEDNALNRMVAESIILQKFGAACECAVDGKIALDMFLAAPERYYDAILMDIQMPNMDGHEATRRIRTSNHPDARQIQIIALSANAFAEDITKSLASGMNAHISKPIEPDVLGETLEKAYIARRG